MISLHDTERVLGTWRKTWLVFLFAGFTSLLLFLAPFVVLWLLNHSQIETPIQVPRQLFGLLSVLWWWSIWTGTFLAFMNYYLDVFVVTDERILHIEQHGAFSRSVAELRLERIQDVSVEQHGLLPTLLHFGNIHVQTAGETRAFMFESVPRPEQLKEVVMQAHRAALMRHQNAPQTGEGL